MDPCPRLLNYREAAEVLGVSTSTLYAMVSRGELPVVQFGGKTKRGCTRFRGQDLATFITAHLTRVNGRPR